MKKLIFLGPPGAGKGTQAKLFSERFGIPHISTGIMCRDAVSSGTEIGNQISSILESGQLIDDQLTLKVVEERIQQSDCSAGYILDGFPRTIPPAEQFEAWEKASSLPPTWVLYFSLPTDVFLKRLESRELIEGRADDSEEIRKKRLNVYLSQTQPLVEFYRERVRLIEIDATPSIEKVSELVAKTVTQLG